MYITFIDQMYLHLMKKMASETTFCHWKVVLSLLVLRITFRLFCACSLKILFPNQPTFLEYSLKEDFLLCLDKIGFNTFGCPQLCSGERGLVNRCLQTRNGIRINNKQKCKTGNDCCVQLCPCSWPGRQGEAFFSFSIFCPLKLTWWPACSSGLQLLENKALISSLSDLCVALCHLIKLTTLWDHATKIATSYPIFYYKPNQFF